MHRVGPTNTTNNNYEHPSDKRPRSVQKKKCGASENDYCVLRWVPRLSSLSLVPRMLCSVYYYLPWAPYVGRHPPVAIICSSFFRFRCRRWCAALQAAYTYCSTLPLHPLQDLEMGCLRTYVGKWITPGITELFPPCCCCCSFFLALDRSPGCSVPQFVKHFGLWGFLLLFILPSSRATTLPSLLVVL